MNTETENVTLYTAVADFTDKWVVTAVAEDIENQTGLVDIELTIHLNGNYTYTAFESADLMGVADLEDLARKRLHDEMESYISSWTMEEEI